MEIILTNHSHKHTIESIKTTAMENVSTKVLDKNKEYYLRCKDKAKKSYDVLRHIQLHMSKSQWNNEDLQSTMSNLQPNCCLKVDFQKVDQHTGGTWFIHDTKRHEDNQLQSLKLPCRISLLIHNDIQLNRNRKYVYQSYPLHCTFRGYFAL